MLAARNRQQSVAEIDIPPLQSTLGAFRRQVLLGTPHTGMQSNQHFPLALGKVGFKVGKEPRFLASAQKTDTRVVFDAVTNPADGVGAGFLVSYGKSKGRRGERSI